VPAVRHRHRPADGPAVLARRRRHDRQTDALFAEQAAHRAGGLGVLLSLVVLLIAGTLKLWPLTATLASVDLPLSWAKAWQDTLLRWVPFDAAKGRGRRELPGLGADRAAAADRREPGRGLETSSKVRTAGRGSRWDSPPRRCWWRRCGSGAATPGCARKSPGAFRRGAAPARVWHYARRLDADDWRAWLWESWRFVKQIFPLLSSACSWSAWSASSSAPSGSKSLAGSNDLLANAVAVVFGVFMYFPTLVEVPVARMFLDLGMHPGPLLAYLMADPELSLQSMLMVAAVIGRPKTAAYVGWVALFSIAAGLIYGAWMDGAGGAAGSRSCWGRSASLPRWR
jgi:hypothetical protein